MAIGKCAGDQDADIDPDAVVIRFGDREVYPAKLDDERLAELSVYLREPEVLIHVSLGTGTDSCTVWGCDLTAGYVRINADYTT
jgi:glutamate N-acetyltransferase/amino-acid N-acetyltransferase